MLKKILLGIGGLVVLVVIVLALGGSSEPQQPQKVGEESSAPTPPAVQDFKVGDRINIRDRILTVNSVDKNWKSSNQFDKPSSPNKVWVVINVAIENAGKDEVAFNSFDYKIQDANGVQSTPGFGGIGLDKISSGQLIPGGKVSGNLIFDVDQAATTNLILLYQPSFWSGQTARVLLQ